MTASILDRIGSPADLKELSYPELEQLAQELRSEMVSAASVHGGHLAPSLGAVEIIMALHRVLDCPHDRIVFDVGHQAYAHKILTGRREAFKTLRTMGGISGFPKITESPYDSHNSGHASDALSTALGYALARDIDGENRTIAALVGDASFVGGMSLEALNEIGNSGTKVIIILNDNGMSISRSVGGFANFLGRARLDQRYISARDRIMDDLESRGRLGRLLAETGNAAKNATKQFLAPHGTMFFEGFGVTYVGPVDGHDLPNLEALIRDAREVEGPVLIHAVTTKGKGYGPAQERPDIFHGVGPFDVETGAKLSKGGAPSWTSVFSSELRAIAATDEDVVAITAAMPDGTGLSAFQKDYPRRFFDVGIAEENAVTMASSLAMAGKKPFVALYSTFAQRAFDQTLINVALQGQHVVFCLDRAGLVGEDGPTHHGAFDLSYMRLVPGMTVLAPSTDVELRSALRTAHALEGPVCVRYARGAALHEEGAKVETWTRPCARQLRQGAHVSLLAVGTMVKPAMDAAELLSARGVECAVWDMRWVKPVDAVAVAQAAACGCVVTVEENSVVGGFGSAVLEELARSGLSPAVTTLGLPDGFVTQGSPKELLASCGLDAAGIAASVEEALRR
ncbi:MAG: 1-deoxy-D-xylulose-5-phosphate synthase [Coriobacteriaceae bacterium]|nr:1-deoxy-D-xylulose-5-phosphate synthase [Coriobacteriaceae bacterium]